LFDAASNCVKASLVYSDHCLQAFAAGDTSLAACARAVDQMLGLCGALSKLASLSSSYLPAMAKVALIGCQDCETECRKHAERHAPCKACAEACHLRGGVQEAGRLIISEMWFRSALNREARMRQLRAGAAVAILGGMIGLGGARPQANVRGP
jgi:hypothetical protein